MDVIYQHAFLTIIAAAGDSPRHGLPGIRDTPRNALPRCAVGARTLVSVPFAKREILQSTWNSRGWTYQEGLLSRRRLVFTDTQVYYQCNAMHCLEGIRAPLEALHVSDKSRMSDQVDMSRVFPLRTVGKQWRALGALISEYLERSLSFESDILDAFRGILAAHERRFSAEARILAGIPISMEFLKETSFLLSYRGLNALADGMSWSFEKDKGDSCILKLERRPGFPSWTWLGWKPREAVPVTLGHHMSSLISDADLEYAGGLVLSWNANRDLIFKRGSTGQIPRFLRVTGSTLQVRVDADGELTDKDDLMRHPRYGPDPRRESWRAIVKWTRRQYSPTPRFPLTFTLLALRNRHAVDIEFLVLYRPPGCGHYHRIDIVNYPWIYADPRSLAGSWGALGMWPKTEVRIG